MKFISVVALYALFYQGTFAEIHDFTDTQILSINGLISSTLISSLDSTLKDPKFRSQFPKQILDKIDDPTIKAQIISNLSSKFELPKFFPSNSARRLNNWSDIYHYLPHLRQSIHLWKLQFVEEVRQNKHEFQSCSDPGTIAEILIPSVEDVIADDLRNGINLNRNYHQ